MFDTLGTLYAACERAVLLDENGDYFDFSDWYDYSESYWGEWGSVEKFLYRDGG